jgi:hypothetical protein
MEFLRRFNLVDSKETEVLRDLEIALRLTDDQQEISRINTALPLEFSTSSAFSTNSSINTDGHPVEPIIKPIESGAQFGCTIDCRNIKVKSHNSDDEDDLMLSRTTQSQSNNA